MPALATIYSAFHGHESARRGRGGGGEKGRGEEGGQLMVTWRVVSGEMYGGGGGASGVAQRGLQSPGCVSV